MTDTIKISRELMPCPHCNGSAEMRLYDCEYFVQCVECFASTVADFQIEDEAAQAWNRRATPPADAADMGGQAGEEVEVVRGEDTVFGRQYVRLDRHRRVLAQHRQQAGKLVDAVEKMLAEMALMGIDDRYRIVLDMRKAIAGWEVKHGE